MDYLFIVLIAIIVLTMVLLLGKTILGGVRVVDISKDEILENMSPDWESTSTLKTRLELKYCTDPGDGTQPIISLGWLLEILDQLLKEGLIERRQHPQTQEEWEANGCQKEFEHRKVGELTRIKFKPKTGSPARELITR